MMSPLLTDYYQLSMASGYWRLGLHNQEAVFHLFFRRNPSQGEYVVASGLQMVISFLENFHFTDEDILYLRSLKDPFFSDDFLAYLNTLSFTGNIDAVPEGTVVFANEPLLRIRAPLLLCQLLETPLINFINFSSAVSTVASRFRTIAGNDVLMEFGLRRAQGPDGGVTASRAAYIGGFDATSNVLAAKKFQLPVRGTMAHSWVMAFDDELIAFQEYARLVPENPILLVDTYSTTTGVDHAIAIGKKLKGIRLDSGDLLALSRMAREKLDHAGLTETKIYASGDITEEKLCELKAVNAPIDGWGVGTYLSTSYKQPALDMVYKLGAIQKNAQWHYKIKLSDNQVKTSDPGILNVARFVDADNLWLRDIIYNEEYGIENNANSDNLLKPIFREGRLVYITPAISTIQAYCLEQVRRYNLSKNSGFVVEREIQLLNLKKKLMAR